MRALIVVLAFAACGDSSQTSPTAAKPVGPAPVVAPSTSALGWWRVADVPGADDIRGGALKIAPDSLAAVDKQGRGMVRDCKSTIAGSTLTITGCGPTLTGTVKGDTIELEHFTMTRITGDEIAKLDAIAKAGADICQKARACYRHAWPQLGRKLNEDFDFGPGPSADTCKNMLAGFSDELTKAGKPLGPCS